MGSKKRPFYRFVATDSRNPRDGRFIETLGFYNPMTNPPDIKLNEEAIIKWMERGATPSPKTESLFRSMGFMQKWQLLKQGVKKEELEQKVLEVKAKNTPPESPDEKAKKAADKKRAAEAAEAAKTAEAEKAAEAAKAVEAEKAAESENNVESADAAGKPSQDAPKADSEGAEKSTAESNVQAEVGGNAESKPSKEDSTGE